MTSVITIVAPVFALILLGAAARHWKVLDQPGLRGLNDLTFYLAIPALLFGSVIEAQALQIVDVALIYFGACLVVFAIGVGLAQRLFRATLAQAAVTGLNACYGNTVMLGVPLVSAAFGPEGLAILLPVIALHSMLLIPLATILIEADGRGSRNPLRIVAATLPSIARNPIIVALAAALGWRMIGIPVHDALHCLLAMLAAAAPTLALFSLGASLPDFAAKGNLRETGLATLLKLVVQPFLVWAFAHVAGVAPLTTAVLVVTAGTPTGANAFFLARRTRTAAASSAGALIIGTIASIVTLSWLIDHTVR